MHAIALIVQCSDRWCEILPSDLVMASYVVEELVAQVLATLFQVVLIEDVSLRALPPRPHQDALLTLSVHALGCDPQPHAKHDLFAGAIEARLSHALTEILGLLRVERFAVC